MIKANAVRLLAIALALAGFAAALFFTALVVWPSAMPFVPALPAETWLPAWLLERAHPGVLLAALGALMMPAGVLIAARQSAFLRAETRRREDRLRRVAQYRSDEARQQACDSRLEPFIGSGSVTSREADRRVA
jgi:hypothetical protein